MEPRKPVSEMTDSEKLTEIVETMRALSDALVTLSQNPMVKAMIPGGLRVS
jgi:hypothetical protein